MDQHRHLRRVLLATAPLLIVLGLAVLPTAVAAAGDLVSNAGVDTVGDTHAVLVADIGETGRATAYFQYRPEGADQWQHTDNIVVQSGDHLRVPVNDLQRDTTYEFRAVVETNDGRYGWTDTQTFTTGDTADGGGEDDSGLGLDPIISALEDLPGAIIEAAVAPFKALLDALLDVMTGLIKNYPTVHPNDTIQQLHQRTFIVAMLLAGPALMGAAIIYQLGGIMGIDPAQARAAVPRLLLASAFGAVSPYLLQLSIDLFHALTVAFEPQQPEFWSQLRFTTGLVIVSVFTAIELLTLALMLVVAKAYIVFAVVASPLIALAWAFPYTRRWASQFIATYWAMLALGPIEMLLLRINLAVLKTTDVPDWLLAMGLFALMTVVPYMLWQASMAMVGGGLLSGRSHRLHPARLYHAYQSQLPPEGRRSEQSDLGQERPTRVQPDGANRYPKDRILNDVDRNNDD